MSVYSAVRCDECGWITTSPTVDRWAVRLQATEHGWDCREDDDLCPGCAAAERAQRAYDEGRDYAAGMEEQ